MKLLEFPCCRRTCPPEEEEKLTPAAKRASLDKRRRRERRGLASLWRPSLMAISENVTSAATAKGAGGWKGKGKAKAKTKVKPVAFRAADCEDHRLREVVPAFAPTAFLF
ncbi:uncharacterized protein LOC122026325 [Zingiber officinale]|uniref:uncharacterized protein LOC122026325 n=1 Tax=Zingiber officinale TaxID=94328 RepID=UPI001C4CF05B|nr:uncharacterized protein LOC122026325 [Zingiber officinale]